MTATDHALCATLIHTRGDLWFSTDPKEREEAKAICRRCPLTAACAQAGLDLGDQARGVWGGMSSGDRRFHRTGEQAFDPDDESDDSVRRRPRQPCGTEGAYLVHRSRGETCELCETEHEARVEVERRARLDELHGSDAGHRLHRLLGETPCQACHDAAIEKRAVDKARRREEGRAAWARRSTAGAVRGRPGAVRGRRVTGLLAAVLFVAAVALVTAIPLGHIARTRKDRS
jgi:hypothetical protein